MPQQPQYLSTDPNAGDYLSSDPNAGEVIVAAPQPRTFGQAYQETVINPMFDTAKGVGAGLASTVYHGGDWIRRGLGMERIIDRPEVQARITPPESAAGKLGFYAEQGAEFIQPTRGAAGLIGKAAEGASLLSRGARGAARLGAEGLASAGVAGLQSGGNQAQMAVAGLAPAALAPVGAVVGAGARALGRAAAGAQEGGIGGAVAGAIRANAPVETKAALTQGLKPANRRLGFDKALDRAVPEIKAVEAEMGQPIEDIDALITATTEAKKRVWAQYERLVGPAAARGAQIDGTPIAEAIVKSIPLKIRHERPEAAAAVEALADKYRKRFNIGDMEELRRDTTAVIDQFYNMFPAARSRAMSSNPAIAHEVAAADAMRTAIDKVLDAPGGGEASRELRRRYGALLEVERAAYPRKMVAARQQPESLSEQIGTVRAAADIARGLWKTMRGGPLGAVLGAADVAAGIAGRETSKFLKEQQTTNALIRRGLAAYKGGLPVPVEFPPPVVIRGALPPANIRLGGRPDPSGGGAVRGQYPVKEPTGRQPLGLPAPARPMPPAPDPSGGMGPGGRSAIPGEYAIPERQGVVVEGPGAPEPPRQPLALPPHVTDIVPRSERYPGRPGPGPMPGAATTRPVEPRQITTWSERAPAKPLWPGETDEDLFRAMFADAKRYGFTGSPTQFRGEFKRAMKDAKDLIASSAGDESVAQPGELATAIRKLGGINLAKESKKHAMRAGQGYGGELRWLLEHGEGQHRKGMGGLVRQKTGKSLDEIELSLRDDPRFKHLNLQGPEEIFQALVADLEAAKAKGGQTSRKTLHAALDYLGVKPGMLWWKSDVPF